MKRTSVLADFLNLALTKLGHALAPKRPRDGAGRMRAIVREAAHRKYMDQLNGVIALAQYESNGAMLSHSEFWQRKRDARLGRWLNSATLGYQPPRHIRGYARTSVHG